MVDAWTKLDIQQTGAADVRVWTEGVVP